MKEHRFSRGSRWVARATGAVLAATGLVAFTACCQKPPACPVPAAAECALGVPAAPRLPRLFRALSAAPPSASYDEKPICTLPHALSDECEVVDDAASILGTGYDCVNGSDAPLGACTGWSQPSALSSGKEAPPCGPGACENLVLDVRDPSGAALHVTFYDDPSCHRAPREPNCQRTGRACYYRVLRVEPAHT